MQQLLTHLRNVYRKFTICNEMVTLADTMVGSNDPDIVEKGLDLFDQYGMQFYSLRDYLENHLESCLQKNSAEYHPYRPNPWTLL